MATIIHEIMTAHERRPALTIAIASILVLIFILQSSLITINDFSFYGAEALAKPWSLITSSFLHADFYHLFFNLIALFWFGCLLELATKVDRKRILFVFILAAFTGGVTTFLVGGRGIGASDAIFGLAGILVVIGFEFLPAVVPIIVLNFVVNLAEIPVLIIHMSGFLTGVLLSIYFKKRGVKGFI